MNSYHSKFKNEYNKHSKSDSNYSISLNQLDQPLDVSNNMNVYDESHVLYYENFKPYFKFSCRGCYSQRNSWGNVWYLCRKD